MLHKPNSASIMMRIPADIFFGMSTIPMPEYCLIYPVNVTEKYVELQLDRIEDEGGTFYDCHDFLDDMEVEMQILKAYWKPTKIKIFYHN